MLKKNEILAHLHWESHKEILSTDYQTDGINSIGYGFYLKEDDDERYFVMTLSGGGDGSSSLLFHVYPNVLQLNKIEYEVFQDFKYDKCDVSNDDFASELWEELTDCGVTEKLWDESY